MTINKFKSYLYNAKYLKNLIIEKRKIIKNVEIFVGINISASPLGFDGLNISTHGV
jgi:hypothetical protein